MHTACQGGMAVKAAALRARGRLMLLCGHIRPRVRSLWEICLKCCQKCQKQGILAESGRIFYNTFRNEGVKI